MLPKEGGSINGITGPHIVGAPATRTASHELVANEA